MYKYKITIAPTLLNKKFNFNKISIYINKNEYNKIIEFINQNKNNIDERDNRSFMDINDIENSIVNTYYFKFNIEHLKKNITHALIKK